MSLVLRNIKGEELTWDELDSNFNYLESLSGGDGNRIITQTGFLLVDQDLTINAGWIWTIAGVQFTNENPVVLNFPYAATSNQRLDLVVMNASSTFVRISGTESETNPVAPSIPNNTLLLTSVLISDGSIGTPTDPILGTQFKKKSESQSFGDTTTTGTNTVIPLRPNGSSYYVFYNDLLESISGFDLSLITGNANADVPYPGKDLIIANNTANPITLAHDGAAAINFFFLDELDLVIPAGERVWLRYGGSSCELLFKSWSEGGSKITENHLFATTGSFALTSDQKNLHQSRFSNLGVLSNLGLTLGNGIPESGGVLNINYLSDTGAKRVIGDYEGIVKKVVLSYVRNGQHESSNETNLMLRVMSDSKYNTDLQLICEYNLISTTVGASAENKVEIPVLSHLPLLAFSNLTWCVRSNNGVQQNFSFMRLNVITEEV